ncbi:MULTISPECIES: UdgX family uracil-DNA binding protein [unclassified Sinorhizobium]|uniref:UdgX family uracil-DNA binding protein n=1 Tax=unclassified Sinorhizobium TaxID=2613772 RepID=UPI003524BDF3
MNLTPKIGPTFALETANAPTLAELRHQAEHCTRCDLYRNATQLVFGEGPSHAEVVFVGEQPGDREDIAGRPFVGPAGRLLDLCLDEAGVDRSRCYVTNAVKHFKYQIRGKRRLHSKPNAGEIQRCAWWLGAELDLLKPSLVVALGATAVYSLLGPKSRVTKERGNVVHLPTLPPVLVTVHPSYLLRVRDEADAEQKRAQFIGDLRKIRAFMRD